MSTAALVVRDSNGTIAAAPAPIRLMRPLAQPSEVIEVQNATRALVHEALKEGRDYGKIPGTDKPTMLKPGAERVALAFGCYYSEPRIIEKEIDHDRIVEFVKVKWVDGTKPGNWEALKAAGAGRNKKFGQKWVWQERHEEHGTSIGLYRYVVAVDVIDRATGQVVGSGVGSCSTMESKYIDRPRDCENTALKMAHKRGLVAACLVTFGLSDEFTQDVEDLPHMTGDATQEGAPRANDQGPDHAPEHTPEPAREPEPELPLTIELALAMPLPGSPKAFGGKGGTPLGELSGKMLESIAKWLATKIGEDAESGADEDSVKVRTLAAIKLIVEQRGGREVFPASAPTAAPDTSNAGTVNPDGTIAPGGKIADAMDRGEGEQRPDPTMRSSTSSAPAPARATTTTEDSSLVSLTKRIGALLNDQKLSDDERVILRKRLDGANDTAALLELLADVEETLSNLPF